MADVTWPPLFWAWPFAAQAANNEFEAALARATAKNQAARKENARPPLSALPPKLSAVAAPWGPSPENPVKQAPGGATDDAWVRAPLASAHSG